MNNRWKSFLVVFIIAFAGTLFNKYYKNNEKVNFIEREINELYSVEIPEYLKDTLSLNEEASYQGYNNEKHTYLIIIDDLKTGRYSLKEYNMILENRYKTGFDNYEITKKKNVYINGFEAIQFYAKASKDEEKVYSFCTVIKGTIDFYQIIAWTSLGDRKRFFKDVEKLVNSFKEI